MTEVLTMTSPTRNLLFFVVMAGTEERFDNPGRRVVMGLLFGLAIQPLPVH